MKYLNLVFFFQMAGAVSGVVVGAGSRGSGYIQYSLDFPHRLKVSFIHYPSSCCIVIRALTINQLIAND